MSAKQQILTIEDDAAIRRGIVDALRFVGYGTLEAGRGDEGLVLALSGQYDLLLLDLVLPGREGLEILREVRRIRPTLPVIILTARGDESDRVQGLRDGADDYVVKPFSVKELLARIEAVLRRTPGRPQPACRIVIPGGRIDLATCEIQFDDGHREELSEREVELLRYLAAHAGAHRFARRDSGPRLADQSPRIEHADDRHATWPGCGKSAATRPPSLRSS